MATELAERDDRYEELEESPYLRRQKPIEVRRSRASRRVALFMKILLGVLGGGAAVALVGSAFWFLMHSSHFALADEKSVEIRGAEHVPPRVIAEKFRAEVGKSIFVIPLAERRRSIEEIPWVEDATVARVLPNALRVTVRERTPVAFLRLGSDLALLDAQGIILEKPQSGEFHFPVVTGITEAMDAGERARRLQLYLTFLREISSDGQPRASNISEVDLTDSTDVRSTLVESDGVVLVHFGDSDFLRKFETYAAHIGEWKQSAQRIESVDLRFEGQVIVNPESKVVPVGTKP